MAGGRLPRLCIPHASPASTGFRGIKGGKNGREHVEAGGGEDGGAAPFVQRGTDGQPGGCHSCHEHIPPGNGQGAVLRRKSAVRPAAD